MPKISFREGKKVKTIYITKTEKEIIKEIKNKMGYKNLYKAYLHYTQENISLPEQIKILETKLSELQKENIELKEKLKNIDNEKSNKDNQKPNSKSLLDFMKQ